MIAFVVFGLLLGAGLPQDASLSWHDDLGRDAFDRIRAETVREDFEAERQGAQAAFLDKALVARGHSGDRGYLEGCDLWDVAADRHAAVVTAALTAATYEEFVAVRDAVAADGLEDSPSASPGRSIEEEAVRRFERDQALRSRSMGLSDGPAPEAIFAERFAAVCEEDLANGLWLDQPSVAAALATTLDQRVVTALVTLGLHADHRPWVQDRFSQILFVRHEAGTASLEPALRLKDAALVNQGRPQMFGMSILCEAGRPLFIGKAEVAIMNPLRVSLGLKPLDLAALPVADYCG